MNKKIALLLCLTLLLTGCGSSQPTPLPPTPLPPTVTPMATRTAVPTATLGEPTATPEPTATASPPASFAFRTVDKINYSLDPTKPLLAALWLPQGKHYDAAVLLVHGGGLTSGNRLQLIAWAEGLARGGYVILSVDYPLQPAAKLAEQVTAVRQGLAYLQRNAKQFGINPAKVAIQGHSAGAVLGGAVFVTPGDEQAAAFFGFYGVYSSDPALLNPGQSGQNDGSQADSTALATNAPGPVILWHGTADSTTRWQQSEAFAQALQAAGKDVTFYKLQGEEHGFDFATNGSLSEQGQVALSQVLDALASKLSPVYR